MGLLDKFFKQNKDKSGKVEITVNNLNEYHYFREELESVGHILDDFNVPTTSEVFTNNGREEHKLSIVGRIIKLAAMVKKGEINTKLDTKIREILHHTADYNSEKPKRDLSKNEYRSLIGKKFKHYKTGNIYMLINYAKDSETLEDMVSYQRISGPDTTIWSRPFDMFFEKVEVNGELVDRFELVKEN